MILALKSNAAVTIWPHEVALALAHYFDCRHDGCWAPPKPLLEWIRACDARCQRGNPPYRSLPQLIARRGGKGLTIRFRCGPGGAARLLFSETEDAADARRYSGIGLTPRESEVLEWIAHGKRDAEIAIILGTRRRTISNHVYRLLGKLGVETRTAAVAEANLRRRHSVHPQRI